MNVDQNPVVVRTEELKKYYPAGSKTFMGKTTNLLRALDGVSLSIHKGEIFGVVGESGCGKSTLGRCVLRLVDVTGGKVIFNEEDISTKKRKELKPLRRNMQMIFQNPFSSFNPKIKIGDSLFEVGKVHGLSAKVTHEKILELLEYISLPEEILLRSPGELSGGQLQRLAIARALLLNPSFIVADEAVSALDVSVQAQILNLIMDLRNKFQMTMMFISHEMTVVEHICDTVAVMYLGIIVETAPTEELFGNIQHPYTEALMSAIPKADPDISAQRIILQGESSNAIQLPAGCRFSPRCPKCKELCTQTAPELRETAPGHFVACHFAAEQP